jgi:hypothetical protein
MLQRYPVEDPYRFTRRTFDGQTYLRRMNRASETA